MTMLTPTSKSTPLAELVEVVIGVDTHTDTHTAAVVHARTGAGLTRHLTATGEVVVELDRPKRPARRAGAKSDSIDAERAARDALSRTRLAQPKTDAERAAPQMRLTARRAAVEAAALAQRQLLALIITSPESVRARFRGQNTRSMLTTAVRLRPGQAPHARADVETWTALTVLRDLARRSHTLETEAAEHERAIRHLVTAWRPDLLQLMGVGPIVAATVLTAWSHPGRCRDEAAFAMLAGTAPIPASSGKTLRYRLDRSGDRQLNRALHTVVLSRLRYDEPTRAYDQG